MKIDLKKRLSIADGRFNNDEINLQSDKIRKKRLLKKYFSEDPAILEVLDNPNLDPECPDEYLGVNILSWLKINFTQDESKNFICFDIDDIEPLYRNDDMKQQILTVMCLVNEKNMETPWNMDRHDALGYLVIDNLNWSNCLGFQCKLISDRADIIDGVYYSRTLKFEIKGTNGLQNGGVGRYDRR